MSKHYVIYNAKIVITFNNNFRNWLQKHCNDEWNVHFKALLKRLRNSLTCEGGFRPDHALAPGKY